MAVSATWRALQPLRYWGWPGLAGLLCLVASAAVASLWLPKLRDEVRALAAAADAAERRAERSGSQRSTQLPSVSAPQRFRDGFPPASARQERLAAMLAVAAGHGLDAKSSEYRLNQERELGLELYTVSLPLASRYPQLRAFIEDAQLRDPALSLDRLRMRRNSAAAKLIETDLSWTFYMQPQRLGAGPSDAARGDVR
jgi:hypothetical protein